MNIYNLITQIINKKYIMAFKIAVQDQITMTLSEMESHCDTISIQNCKSFQIACKDRLMKTIKLLSNNSENAVNINSTFSLSEKEDCVK
jgi:hypothetical protein